MKALLLLIFWVTLLLNATYIPLFFGWISLIALPVSLVRHWPAVIFFCACFIAMALVAHILGKLLYKKKTWRKKWSIAITSFFFISFLIALCAIGIKENKRKLIGPPTHIIRWWLPGRIWNHCEEVNRIDTKELQRYIQNKQKDIQRHQEYSVGGTRVDYSFLYKHFFIVDQKGFFKGVIAIPNSETYKIQRDLLIQMCTANEHRQYTFSRKIATQKLIDLMLAEDFETLEKLSDQ